MIKLSFRKRHILHIMIMFKHLMRTQWTVALLHIMHGFIYDCKSKYMNETKAEKLHPCLRHWRKIEGSVYCSFFSEGTLTEGYFQDSSSSTPAELVLFSKTCETVWECQSLETLGVLQGILMDPIKYLHWLSSPDMQTHRYQEFQNFYPIDFNGEMDWCLVLLQYF